VPELTILNRTPERAHQLAEALTTGYGGRVLVDGLEGWDQRLTPGCLVVQTTSAALREGSAVPLPSFWPPGAVLSELIYGRQTPLAAAVSALGGRVQDGLPMLIHQAAESLAIWLQRPLQEIPVDSMLRAARRRLA
jgi:shikimate dehydrogenase